MGVIQTLTLNRSSWEELLILKRIAQITIFSQILQTKRIISHVPYQFLTHIPLMMFKMLVIHEK